MSAALEKDIVAALGDENATAASLGELVSRTEAAITEADVAADAARVAFLDPIVEPDAHRAKAKVEATTFVAARLRTLLPRIQDRYREVEADEDRAEWEIDFRALAGERNELAKELKTTYPAAVATLVDLFARVADLDRRLSQLHQTRPSAAKGYLLSAELVARELTEFSRDEPSITRDLKLPDWSESNKLAWPPSAPTAGLVLATAVAPAFDRRYSADWYQALAEDTKRRKLDERQRIADEASRETESRRVYESR